LSFLPRLLRYGGLNAVHGVVTALAAAAAAGLLYRRLDLDFGLLALITGGMVRLNLVDDSLGTYVVTAVAGDKAEAPRRLEVAVQLYLGLALLFATIFGIAVALLLRRREEVLVLAGLASAGLFLATLCNLLGKVLEGHEDYLALRLAQSGVAVVRLAAVGALFLAGVAALSPYVLLYVLTYVALLVLLVVLVRRRAPGILAPGWWRRGPDARERRGVVTFLRPLLVAKGASVVSYRLDLWVVQVLAGGAATAAYALAEALAGLAAQTLEVLKALLPISVREWRRDPAWVRRLVLSTSQLSLLLVGGVCVVAFAAAEPVLILWFGDAPTLAITAARLLLIFYALTSFRSVIQVVLAGQGLFGHLERHFLVAAGLNFLLSLFATWQLGGWGAALGTALSGIYLLLANLSAGQAALGLDGSPLLRRVVIPGLACMVLAGLAAALPTVGPPLADLAVRGALAGVVYLVAFWFLVLSPAQRRAGPRAVLRRPPEEVL